MCVEREKERDEGRHYYLYVVSICAILSSLLGVVRHDTVQLVPFLSSHILSLDSHPSNSPKYTLSYTCTRIVYNPLLVRVSCYYPLILLCTHTLTPKYTLVAFAKCFVKPNVNKGALSPSLPLSLSSKTISLFFILCLSFVL